MCWKGCDYPTNEGSIRRSKEARKYTWLCEKKGRATAKVDIDIIIIITLTIYIILINITWSKHNFNQLLEYVPLNDIVRLRACYWTAKEDDSVLYRVREEVVDSNQLLDVEFDENSLRGVLDQYNWYPQAMKREYGPRRIWTQDTMFPPMNAVRRHWWKHYTNEFDHNTNLYILLKKMYSPHRHEQPTKVMTKWFKHITNNVATNHWAKTTKPLLPSAYLNIEIDSDQYSFLNPTMQDVLLSTLEMDSYGNNAKKKRARRRMCIVNGSAKSYEK